MEAFFTMKKNRISHMLLAPLPPQGGFSVTSEELAALELLKSTGLPILEAAQVACAACRAAQIARLRQKGNLSVYA